jgi:adenylate cyclase
MKDGSPRILVVDDDEDNRYTLTRRLRREGYLAVETARNGREALEILAGRPFDLILLDIMMPEVGGYEVLDRVKTNPLTRDIPVIMISALAELDSVVRCIEHGAEDYLPKPFNPVLLRARIGACVERKRLHDQEIAHLAVIERERQRADDLLAAILPAPAITELKTSGAVRPRRFEDVAILFADVINFTAWCDRHSPEAIVANLQLLVHAFERLATAHGLEKLKTVGDTLMATAGLLVPHADPAMAALGCARTLTDAARGLPAPWELRMGIHVGPVIAGVVGHTKFSFDIWGDTVNVAARLAGLGNGAGIHLSASAWSRLGDRVQGHALGRIPVKGKGEIEVFRI